MLLVQRIFDTSCDITPPKTLKVLGTFYKNMRALEADMKTNPQDFNDDCEYSLIEPRPFVTLTWEKKATVTSQNMARNSS